MRDRLPESKSHDDLLLALLYDELPPEEAAAARETLAAEAPESLERLAEWRAIRDVVADLPELEPDPQIHYDVIREARRAVEDVEKPSRLWLWLEQLTLMPALAGLLLVVLAAGLTLRLSTDMEQAPDEALPGLAERSAPAATKDAPAPGGPKAAAVAPATETAAPEAADEPADDTVAGDAAEGEATPAPGEGATLEGLMAAPGDGRAAGAKTKKLLEADEKPAAVEKAPSKAKSKAAEPVPARKAEEPTRPDRASRRGTRAEPEPVETLRRKSPPRKRAPRKRAPKPSPKPAREPQTSAGKGAIDDLLDSAPPPAPSAAPPIEPVAIEEAEDAEQARAEDAGQNAVLGAELDKQADDAPTGGAARGATRYAPPPPAPAADEAPAERVVEQAVGQAVGANAQPEAGGDITLQADAAATPRDEEQREETQRAVDGDEERLSRARILRGRGLHREAVGEYEAFLNENQGASGLDRVWYEAAESYRALGQTDRALQLYRLVAGGDSGYADRARDRIATLTAREPDRAKDTPRAAPPKSRSQAAPVFDEVEAVERE